MQFGILEGVSRPQEIIGGRLYEVFTFRGLHLGDMASIHFCTSAYVHQTQNYFINIDIFFLFSFSILLSNDGRVNSLLPAIDYHPL